MKEFNPDTYCGIYCGACSVVACGETGRADGFAACLASVPKKDLTCGGCKSDNIYAGCGTCSIRSCARKTGVGHCIECADYPCQIFKTWLRVARLLPHGREVVANLEAIRRDGADSWLAAQKERWSCPECGAPFSWYAPECAQCGRSTESYRLTGWRRLLCRLVLPRAYRKGKAGKG